jgi:hypothetical protein
METVDQIRNSLISKIQTITNKDFLLALNNLISSSAIATVEMELNEEQELMLQMSEDDIHYGRIISQDDLKTKTKAWLDTKKD